MTMANSGAGPMTGDARSAEAARKAMRGLIAKAIRDYPATTPRGDWKYGLDDLDFEDFVPELADHIMKAITGSAR